MNNHCIMTADGQNWTIASVHWPLMTLVNGDSWSVWDISEVNWDSYVDEAVRMIENDEARRRSMN